MEENTTLDLFGNTVPLPKSRNQSLAAKVKVHMGYRKAKDHVTCCRTCDNFRIKVYSRHYYKCKLLGLGSSIATDIQASGLCDHWRKLEGKGNH